MLNQEIHNTFLVKNRAGNDLDPDLLDSLLSFVSTFELCPSCGLKKQFSTNINDRLLVKVDLEMKEIEIFES